MITYDNWKTENPENLENKCEFCAEQCEDRFCSRECERGYIADNTDRNDD